MTAPRKPASREWNALLDRYLEVSNHYSDQLVGVEADKDRASRLSLLLKSLEGTDVRPGARPIDVMADGVAQGQQIVPTQDTLDALADYRDDILARLEKVEQDLPRNIQQLKKLFAKDVKIIVTAFESFTLAWDKLVELSRLTVVPDGRQLLVRDTVSMATLEFERFAAQLQKFVGSRHDAVHAPGAVETKRKRGRSAARLQSLTNDLLRATYPNTEWSLANIKTLLSGRGAYFETPPTDTLQANIAKAREDIDCLALFGLALGFVHWLDSDSGLAHRKVVVKTLIYASKILLIEKAWARAVTFTEFAIKLTGEANQRAQLEPDEGTSMFQCNRLWALHKSGGDVNEELNRWDVSRLHTRYKFLKDVLLQRHEDAVGHLDILVLKPKGSEQANLSILELEEWPILQEFKESAAYKKWKSHRQSGP